MAPSWRKAYHEAKASRARAGAGAATVATTGRSVAATQIATVGRTHVRARCEIF